MTWLDAALLLLSEPSNLILVIMSFIGSFISASMGIGGGTLMLATIASILPAPAIIPVHGVVQLGSNLGRTLLLLAHVHWKLCVAFTTGAIIGVAVGGQIVVSLPSEILKPVLGGFILFSVWGPKLKPSGVTLASLGLGGVITSTMTMFVGATGPLVIALIRTFQLSPMSTVATNSVCLCLQHSLKIAAFGLLGFGFGPYLGIISLMIILGFLGTFLGKQVLLKTPPERFDLVLKIILSVLAVRLLIAP